MEKAWSILEELGAVDEGGRLTPLGRHIVRDQWSSFFPLLNTPSRCCPLTSGLQRFDLWNLVNHGRLTGSLQILILGTIFQCLGPVLTIAASLSSKPLFLNPMDKRDEATKYVLYLWEPYLNWLWPIGRGHDFPSQVVTSLPIWKRMMNVHAYAPRANHKGQ